MMDPNELRARFSGVIAFPITPFKKDLSLDSDGLRENLAQLLEHPVCAVVAAGGGRGKELSDPRTGLTRDSSPAKTTRQAPHDPHSDTSTIESLPARRAATPPTSN